MKRCPICDAVAFDDAKTCYGCLHHFASGDAAKAPREAIARGAEGNAASHAVAGAAANEAGAIANAPVARGDAAEASPTFLVSVHALRGADGKLVWRCDVGCRDEAEQAAAASPVAACA